MLVCLNRRSQTNPAVVENGVFCVNTLGAGEAQIADVFAGRTGVTGSDRFATGDWMVLSTGTPVLRRRSSRSTAGSSRCGRSAATTCSSARSQEVRLGPAGPALVYHERAYKQGVSSVQPR